MARWDSIRKLKRLQHLQEVSLYFKFIITFNLKVFDQIRLEENLSKIFSFSEIKIHLKLKACIILYH